MSVSKTGRRIGGVARLDLDRGPQIGQRPAEALRFGRVDVGGEDLDVDRATPPLEMLIEQDRQRIRFLAGGTAGHPRPELVVRVALGNQVRQQLGLDFRVGISVAKEPRHAN